MHTAKQLSLKDSWDHRVPIPYGDIHSEITQEAGFINSLGLSAAEMLENIRERFTMGRYQVAFTELIDNGQLDLGGIEREKVLQQSRLHRLFPEDDIQELRRILRDRDFAKILSEQGSNQDDILGAWHWVESHDKEAFAQVTQLTKDAKSAED